MLGSVTSDDFVDAVVAAQREVDLEDVVAGLHQSQDSLHLLSLLIERCLLLHVLDERVLHDLTSSVEEIFDLDGRKIDKNDFSSPKLELTMSKNLGFWAVGMCWRRSGI